MWRSTKDTLPDLGVKVLVYIKNPTMGIFNGEYKCKDCPFIAIGTYCCPGIHKWSIDGYEFKYPAEVMYWQPLPESPQ